jgi:hypothetical protein
MPAAKIVVPLPKGGDIVVRQFQPQDAAQVDALMIEGIVYGRKSLYFST